jgi:ketosteroid isomerase-like protein
MGCELSKKDDTSAVVEKIKNHYKAWQRGAENGDVDAYFDAITNDFVYLQAGNKPVDNRDTLRSMLDSFFANNTFSVPDMTSHNIEVWDDIAIHRYTASNVITSKVDSSIVELERRYIDVYKKDEEGRWKAYLHLNFILE